VSPRALATLLALACTPSQPAVPQPSPEPASPAAPSASDTKKPDATPRIKDTDPPRVRGPANPPPLRQLSLPQVRERAFPAQVHYQLPPSDRTSRYLPQHLVHPAFATRIGPFDDAVLYFNRASTGRILVGWVAAEQDGERHVWQVAFPCPGELGAVEAVLFEDVDSDNVPDPIIIYSWMLGHGPEGTVDRYSAVAIRWDGEAFVADDSRFFGLENANAARVRDWLRATPGP